MQQIFPQFNRKRTFCPLYPVYALIFKFNEGTEGTYRKGYKGKVHRNRYFKQLHALLRHRHGRDITSDDQNEKFVEIKKTAREIIFTAFSCVPALFGLMSESTGFNEQEFESAYKLYFNTQIKSIQKKINNQVSKVLGVKDAIVFQPLIISWDK